MLGLVFLQPLLISPYTNESVELPKVIALRMAVIGAACVGVVITLRNGMEPRWLVSGTARLEIVVAVLVASSWAIATATSPAPSLSWWGVEPRWSGLRTQLCYLAIFLLSAVIFQSKHSLVRLTTAATGAAALTSLYAIAQGLGLDPFPWSQGVAGQFAALTGQGRVFATLGNPDFLAAYLVLAIPLTSALAFWLFKKRSRLLCLIVVVAAILELTAMLLTASRDGWIGSAVALSVLAAWLLVPKRNLRRFVLGAVSTFAVVVLAGWLTTVLSPSFGSFSRISDAMNTQVGTTAVRIELWRVSASVVADRPLTGYGPDMLGSVIDRHYTPRLVSLENTPAFVIDRAHNAILDSAASAGILGLASLAVLAWLTGTLVVRTAWRIPRNSVVLIAGIGTALIGHLVEQQFDLETTAASTLAWILAGALVGVARANTQETSTIEQPATFKRGTQRALVAALATLSVLMIGEVVADFRLVDADVAYASALQAERAGAVIQAASELDRAVSDWPTDPAYWNELGKVRSDLARSNRGDFAWSIQAMRAALTYNPASALLWSNMGLVAGNAAAGSANSSFATMSRQAHDAATTMAPGFWLYWRSKGATLFNSAM